MAYTDGQILTKVNDAFWPGPNVAGSNKGTLDKRTPRLPLNATGPTADDGNGARGTIYQGRHDAGSLRNQIGPNAAGQPRAITKP
jgi:hypothetical protein